MDHILLDITAEILLAGCNESVRINNWIMQCYTCILLSDRPFSTICKWTTFHFTNETRHGPKKGPKEIYFDKMLSVSYARVARDKKTTNEQKNWELLPSNEKRIPYNWYNNILGLIHMLVALTKLHSQHLCRDNIESNQKNNNNNEVKKKKKTQILAPSSMHIILDWYNKSFLINQYCETENFGAQHRCVHTNSV